MMPESLYPRIEDLAIRIRNVHARAETETEEKQAQVMHTALRSLCKAVDNHKPIFGTEPWHPVNPEKNLGTPAEFLLRLPDENGDPLPAYNVIMAYYDNGLTEPIDTLLVLCALRQFRQSAERQVSINISARSLLSADFIKTVLSHLEKLRLDNLIREGVIIEIHESAPTLVMSKHVLSLFHRFGARFAIDDVELSLGDAFRFSEFDEIASFIKIDRKLVCAPPESPNSLPAALSFVRSVLPDAKIVAEGVQSVEHARELHEFYPEIDYMQGLHLPDRVNFRERWNETSSSPRLVSNN
ncbi:MAG: EAL domain-containing protein [Alphaproteobacteria bacterium]|jgi:EAL domain-containing protein (putative c-di-GMP-specific phosphodiesterase class I)|nr:EAL domain-containing protein [Alphaproteobacteria bacterium]QQS57528.1 MAG: EAL domain-containing protein [Alphaproteobacteria bacterium]